MRFLLSRYASRPDWHGVERPGPGRLPRCRPLSPRPARPSSSPTDLPDLPRPAQSRGDRRPSDAALLHPRLGRRPLRRRHPRLRGQGHALSSRLRRWASTGARRSSLFPGRVDALVSLTGFSLVGGPAYNDSPAAVEMLSALDVPYIAAHPLEFQTLGQWSGLGSGPWPGRDDHADRAARDRRRDQPHRLCRAAMAPAAAPAATMPAPGASDSRADGALRRTHRERWLKRRCGWPAPPQAQRREEGRPSSSSAFRPMPAPWAPPPIFRSSKACMQHADPQMKADGYDVDVPETVDDLRTAVLQGNAAQFGQEANVAAPCRRRHDRAHHAAAQGDRGRLGPRAGQDPVRRARRLRPGPQFGNVFVGIQPVFGYEGDPMRLLFERASRRPTPSRPSTSGCGTPSAPTWSCISGCTARSNSCRANRRAWARVTGPTG
jgi:magnesium chelatase subunit H